MKNKDIELFHRKPTNSKKNAPEMALKFTGIDIFNTYDIKLLEEFRCI